METPEILSYGVMVIMIIGPIGLTIVGIYSIKSGERSKREVEITKREALKHVSEGKMSLEDAEKLINPKKPWWKGLS